MEDKAKAPEVSRRELMAGTAAAGLAAAGPALGDKASPERLQPRFRRRVLDK